MIVIDPETWVTLVDVLNDPDFDVDLLLLDVELSTFAPPGYSRLDDEELLARLPIAGRKLA